MLLELGIHVSKFKNVCCRHGCCRLKYEEKEEAKNAVEPTEIQPVRKTLTEAGKAEDEWSCVWESAGKERERLLM
jgi:hypothetical protein